MSKYGHNDTARLDDLCNDFRAAAGASLFGIVASDLVEAFDHDPQGVGWETRLPEPRLWCEEDGYFIQHVAVSPDDKPDRAYFCAYYGDQAWYRRWLSLANRAYRLARRLTTPPNPSRRLPPLFRKATEPSYAADWLVKVHRIAWEMPADDTLSTRRETRLPGRTTRWYPPDDWEAWARDHARKGRGPLRDPDLLPTSWFSILPRDLDLFTASAEAIRAIQARTQDQPPRRPIRAEAAGDDSCVYLGNTRHPVSLPMALYFGELIEAWGKAVIFDRVKAKYEDDMGKTPLYRHKKNLTKELRELIVDDGTQGRSARLDIDKLRK